MVFRAAAVALVRCYWATAPCLQWQEAAVVVLYRISISQLAAMRGRPLATHQRAAQACQTHRALAARNLRREPPAVVKQIDLLSSSTLAAAVVTMVVMEAQISITTIRIPPLDGVAEGPRQFILAYFLHHSPTTDVLAAAVEAAGSVGAAVSLEIYSRDKAEVAEALPLSTPVIPSTGRAQPSTSVLLLREQELPAPSFCSHVPCHRR